MKTPEEIKTKKEKLAGRRMEKHQANKHVFLLLHPSRG